MELALRLLVALVVVIFRIIGFLVMLMVTAIASMFVGIPTAINRISMSWIEQATGNGAMIGYNPVTRDGIKVAAGFMLVVGWLLTIATIYLIVTLIAN